MQRVLMTFEYKYILNTLFEEYIKLYTDRCYGREYAEKYFTKHRCGLNDLDRMFVTFDFLARLRNYYLANLLVNIPSKHDKRVKSRSHKHGAATTVYIPRVPNELVGAPKEIGWIHYATNKVANNVVKREGKWLRRKQRKKATSRSKRRALRMECK